MQQYKQLAYEQRCQIEILKKRGLSQKEIAESVGVSQSTISREISRNTGKRGYRCKQAQESHETRRQWCRRCSRITPRVERLIVSMLNTQFSPEQISGRLAIEHGIALSKLQEGHPFFQSPRFSISATDFSPDIQYLIHRIAFGTLPDCGSSSNLSLIHI